MLGEGLLREVMEGKMVGNWPRGRPRIGMLEELKEDFFENMKRRAENREEWRVGCHGPTVWQNSNDDDDDQMMTSCRLLYLFGLQASYYMCYISYYSCNIEYTKFTNYNKLYKVKNLIKK